MTVEHDAELAVLGTAVQALAGGDSAQFEVVGPTGVGRSAMLRYVAAAGERAGATVLTASGSLGEFVREHHVVHDLLARLKGRAPAGARRPSSSAAFLLETARVTPLLLVVDDAQWLDDASRTWLAGLARRGGEAAIMIVVASDGVRPVLDSATVLALRPLGTDAIAELVTARFREQADPEFLEAAVRCTRGRPAVLRSVLDRLAAAGLAPCAEHVPDLIDHTVDEIGEVVARTLRTLPAEAVELLRAIAICRPEFDLDLVHALAPVRALTPARALDLLVNAGLITSRERPVLVAGVGAGQVLSGIPQSRRGELFARAALLGYRSAVAEEAVARLLAGAPPSGESWVVPVLRAAARRERERGRTWEAARHLERALREPLEPAERAGLIVELAVTEGVHAPEIGDRRLARMLLEPSLTGVAATRTDAAEQLLARGDSALARRTFSAVYATGVQQHSFAALYWLADDAPHEEPGLGVLEVPELPEAPADPARAGVAAWRCAALGTDLARTRQLARAALAGRPDLLIPRVQACRALMLTDDVDEATAGLDAVVTEARRRGLTAVTSLALVVRAKVKARRGWIEDAAADLERAGVELPRSSWHPAARPVLVALDMLLSLERGLVERAEALSASAPPEGGVNGFAATHLTFSRGLLALASGDAGTAAARFQDCGRRLLARRWGNPALLTWRTVAAIALRTTGDTERAVRLVAEERELARRWGAPSTVGSAHLGSALVLTGDDAHEHRRAAVRLLRDSPMRVRYATALLELAAAGDPAEAPPLVREAAEIALIHHANPLVSRARELGWVPGGLERRRTRSAVRTR